MTELPEGWLTEREAAELRRLAQDRTVLELGAWKGRSTVVLAEVARYVVSVDRHQGINEDHPEDSLPEYLGAVRGLQNVGIVIAEFRLFTPWLRAFDMVYVDGDHEFLSVEADALTARALATQVVAFHDWDFDPVRTAASGVFGEPMGVVGSVAHYLVGR